MADPEMVDSALSTEEAAVQAAATQAAIARLVIENELLRGANVRLREEFEAVSKIARSLQDRLREKLDLEQNRFGGLASDLDTSA